MRRNILTLLWSCAAFAGDVTGVVLDADGRAIPGARVECGGQVTPSDGEGRFAFPARRCWATVSAEGFESRRMLLAEGAQSSITLSVAGVSERIVVSATRSEAVLEESGVAGTVVTADEIEQRQFPLIPDLLRETPGVQVARFGRFGGATQVFVRGAQRTGTLVLIDGVPVNDPGGDLNFAHLASGSIERMEVIRGPESALFGAEASAGVIQLFTRRGDPERRWPRGTLSYERGSFQTDRWIANIAGGAGERFDYSLGAEQLHTVSEFPNDFYRNTTGNANLGLRLSQSTQARGVLRVFDSSTGVPNRTAYRVYDFDANRVDRDALVSLRLDDVRGPHFTHRALFGYNRLNDLFIDNLADGPYRLAALLRDVPGNAPRTYLVELLDPDSLPAVLPAGTRIRQVTTRLAPSIPPSRSITERTNFDYQGILSSGAGLTLFGYEFERQEGVISGRDVSRNNHGIFLQQQYRLSNRVFFTAGARLEQNSVFRTKFTPRAAVSVRLSGDLYLRASAGRGITEPSLLQSFAQESTYVGNPNLRLEKTTSYDIGLLKEWFGRRLRSEASVFQNTFRDLIVFVSLPTPPFGTFDNIEAGRARGVEVIQQARLGRSVTVSGTYMLLLTRVTKSNSPFSFATGLGQELPRRPKHSGAVTLTVAPRRWSFQAGASFVGERQDTDPFGITRNPGYQSVYAGGAYQAYPHVLPFVRVENLLNARWQEVLGYSSLSRTVRGGLRVEW